MKTYDNLSNRLTCFVLAAPRLDGKDTDLIADALVQDDGYAFDDAMMLISQLGIRAPGGNGYSGWGYNW